jgi:hypothetical protein
MSLLKWAICDYSVSRLSELVSVGGSAQSERRTLFRGGEHGNRTVVLITSAWFTRLGC